MRRTAIALLTLSGCIAISKVDLQHVKTLEINTEPVHVVREKNWAKALAGATCHDDQKKWIRGKDAVLVMDDGARVGITGVSEDGHILRISNVQWCELTDAAWAALWK